MDISRLPPDPTPGRIAIGGSPLTPPSLDPRARVGSGGSHLSWLNILLTEDASLDSRQMLYAVTVPLAQTPPVTVVLARVEHGHLLCSSKFETLEKATCVDGAE